MYIEPEFNKDYYEGESLDEVINAIRSVGKRRFVNSIYWREIRDKDDLIDIFLSSRPVDDFYEERLHYITADVLRAYIEKVSELYKEVELEDYKILDALLTINNYRSFFLFCFELIDSLKFEY